MTGDVYSGFLGQLRQMGSGRGERDTSDGGSAPRSLHACLRSPEKRQKITPVIEAITPGQRLKVEFMKKNREVAQKQEGKGFSVKNKTYFERNEETVCG